MTKLYFVILLSSLYLLTSCKSASKAYEKGNYDDAIEIAIKKLQKDPNDYNLQQVLKKSYNNAVRQHEDQIRIISSSTSDTRYERVYSEYISLQNLYTMIGKYPSALTVVQPTDYSGYVETFREKAADVHVEKAIKYLEDGNGDKQAYRDAYLEFRAALRFKPNDFELKQSSADALDRALTKVVVIPIDSYRNYSGFSSYQLHNFQADIMRTLAYHSSNDFVKFYSELEARNKNIEPDQIMELNLSRIQLGIPSDQVQTREVSKEVVVKEIVHRPDSITKQYAKVYAKITSVKRMLISEGDLVISIRDTRGNLVWADRFTGQHTWQTEFCTYTGDERALSATDKQQLNTVIPSAPQNDEVMTQLFQQIQNDMSYRLRNYYSRY